MRRTACLVLAGAVAACSSEAPDPQAIARAAEVPDPALFGATPCEDGEAFGEPASAAAPDALRATYARSCAACHANPAAGAPLAHDTAAWAERLERGLDTLVDNTVSGVRRMPPMGLCMDCSPEQFRALIEFMSRPEPSS